MRENKTGREISRPVSISELELEGGFEFFAGPEADGLGGLNLDGFAGLRVAAHSRGAGLHVEGSESDELEGLVFLEGLFDAFEAGIQSALRGGLGLETGVLVFLNHVDEFCFVHTSAPR
jgi:hypothetical protein